MPPRIAIASPSLNVRSETFIAAHLQRIQGQVVVLSDGLPPRRADGHPLLLPVTLGQRMRSWWERRVERLDQSAQRQRRTAEVLRAHKVQVLLAEFGHTAQSLVPACRDAHVPLVAHFHGRDAHAYDLAEQWDDYAPLFAYAAAIVVVSRAMEQRILQLGAPADKVHYNPYGVDVDLFTAGKPAEAPPHFLGIGRFVDKKAPYLTLLAFRKVVDQRPEARLTLVGDGPLWEACNELVTAFGLDAHVALPGVQDPEWIATAMRSARAFVQHSVVPSDGDSEGTPLAVLEAMATGIPVVATRHAGIADVVADGERGLLCEERDIDAMAAHMVRLVDDPGSAGTMGRAGRAYVERHHRVEDRVAALEGILARVARP